MKITLNLTEEIKLINEVKAYDDLTPFSEQLLIARNNQYKSYYAPFDYVNKNAKLVIVGITPGSNQAHQALTTMRTLLNAGVSIDNALEQAKSVASFSGPLRKNLVEMLNHIRLNEFLGVDDCNDLFLQKNSQVHFTSILRYPVLKGMVPLSSCKGILNNPLLSDMIEKYFINEVKALPNAIYLPLGNGVSEILHVLVGKNLINSDQILDGLTHPSGANNERISYFLGKKSANDCSVKTNTKRIDEAKNLLIENINSLLLNRRSA